MERLEPRISDSPASVLDIQNETLPAEYSKQRDDEVDADNVLWTRALDERLQGVETVVRECAVHPHQEEKLPQAFTVW